MTRPVPTWMIEVRRRAIAGSHGKVTLDEMLTGELRGRRHTDAVRVRENICFEIIERGGACMDAAAVVGYSTSTDNGRARIAADRCWNRIREQPWCETRDQHKDVVK